MAATSSVMPTPKTGASRQLMLVRLAFKPRKGPKHQGAIKVPELPKQAN